MQFQPGGLCTLGGSGRRWVARGGNATGLDQKNGGSFYLLPPFFGVGVSFV